MKKLIMAILLALPILGWGAPRAKDNQCRDATVFPGTYLKWIKIAEPIFHKNHLDLDNYNLVIDDGPESVTILLRSTDATCEGYGSTGSHPDFEVAINKKDKRIMHYNFER